MGGPANPYIWVGEPVAPQPGGQGRPPRCRAARAGRPAAGRPAPRDLRANNFTKVFAQKPLPPRSGAARSRPSGSGAAGVYFCKLRKRKYIFVKNKNIKYKNKKPRHYNLHKPMAQIRRQPNTQRAAYMTDHLVCCPPSHETEYREQSKIHHGD